MPEAEVVEPVVAPEAPSLGWRAGLPDDLKQNTDIASYKTVGDFTKDALQWKGKVAELEGQVAESIPKLPDDASDEDKATYYTALGRPKNASEYEFDQEDKNAPEWTNQWKQTFHGLGLTKDQAKQLSGAFNKQITAMVEAHNTAIKAEHTAAEQRLRTEMGDKYDTNVELAKRMYSKHLGTEFDADFADATPTARFAITRLLLKVGALTGEDTSPQGGHSVNKGGATAGFDYSKSPKPPVK